MEDARIAQNWRLTLAYDGTEFSGWQVQPGRRTIQGELREAIERVTRERVLPQGSGRTDAGVHALGQVASVTLLAPIPQAALLLALNRMLPDSIRILKCEQVPPGFHARLSARSKTYEYRIFRGPICPPFLARYICTVRHRLNTDAMQRAAASLQGKHDFTSFAASDPERRARRSQDEKEANIRAIYTSEWMSEGEMLTYRINGDGFLHHMVRNLVGTLLDVGRGRTKEDDIQRILDAHSRSAAGPTAPARGLFLVAVQY